MTRINNQYDARMVYDAIVDLSGRLGYPPSQVELAEACGMRSRASAREWIAKLVEMGLVAVAEGRVRTVRVLRPWPTDQ